MQKEQSNEFNVRVEWREGDTEFSIDDENGDKIYEGMPERILDNMWRDLAMKAIATGDKATASAVVSHCYKAKKQTFGMVLWRIYLRSKAKGFLSIGLRMKQT